MAHNKFDQTLALAGIYQAASLVKQIANNGQANTAHIDASLETLFRFDANSVEDIYGNITGVSHGLKILHHNLADRSNRDFEINKYVISLTMLERKLSNKKMVLDLLSNQLKKIESQFNFFALNHENTFAKLSQLYKETVSPLGAKIMVSGEQTHLNNERNADRVRALLLAGIRSAVLWKQCGGSRWQFIFSRNAYVKECEKILSQI